MKIDGVPRRTIWLAEDGESVEVIDQTLLPHELSTRRLTRLQDAAEAIRSMVVRGAPLIGATAAYGLCLQARVDDSDAALEAAGRLLLDTRPTAVNLRWAVERVLSSVRHLGVGDRACAAYETAAAICEEEVATCESIGAHGLELIRRAWDAKSEGAPVHVLTHCNAGWLATVDWGTALAPVYMAHDAGLPVHVWVGETRPRNQGASLTAWELARHGVSHTVVTDNAGGHLMQRGDVDLCITGTDRTLASGDVFNKVGTYLKALAAHDTGVPFYVAVPGSSIDWATSDAAAVPIEERSAHEVTHIAGRGPNGSRVEVLLTPEGSQARNHAFDVTPARLVTGLITDRGVCRASSDGILGLFPERGA
ncbi:MAG TPA: S-methyl-5-thioribose-1-phosphate isomerase [Longimicrobiales bacterium]|nr:S-methyl-5-thioribose-1-phosphate isomerase [Longimicrobiales bacterium]